MTPRHMWQRLEAAFSDILPQEVCRACDECVTVHLMKVVVDLSSTELN